MPIREISEDFSIDDIVPYFNPSLTYKAKEYGATSAWHA